MVFKNGAILDRDPSLGVFWKDDIDENPVMDLFTPFLI
jgi:hypothetical protein